MCSPIGNFIGEILMVLYDPSLICKQVRKTEFWCEKNVCFSKRKLESIMERIMKKMQIATFFDYFSPKLNCLW